MPLLLSFCFFFFFATCSPHFVLFFSPRTLISLAMLRNSLVRPPMGLQNWQCMVDGKVSDGPCPDIAENDPTWQQMVKQISPGVNPIGRIARPEEVASLIVYLAGPGYGTVSEHSGGGAKGGST